MPELPEVETTVRGLRDTVVGLKIKDVWTDLKSTDKRQKESVANPSFFAFFKKEVLDKKVLSVERRAKNILINLSNEKTILIHMKMTGHLLYGKYEFKNNKWIPKKANSPLSDPFNRFMHLVFSFSNGKHLAFSDARKFGKVTLLDTKIAHETKHLKYIGPEPLDKDFTLKILKERLMKKPKGKIKTVLMDQSILAGIGNIYSDEILWLSGVHPEKKVSELKEKELGLIFKATRVRVY
jgi:formamidopyrimidine-DNA glycosylase